MTWRGWLAIVILVALCFLFGGAWLHDRTRADHAEGALAQAEKEADRKRDDLRGELAEARRNLARCQSSSSDWSEEETQPDGTKIRRRGRAAVSVPVLPCPPCPVCPDLSSLYPARPLAAAADRVPLSLLYNYGPIGWAVGADWEFRAPMPFRRGSLFLAPGASLGFVHDPKQPDEPSRLDWRGTLRVQIATN